MIAGSPVNGSPKTDDLQHRLLERPSREDVLHGYRLILGREPEDEDAIRAHMQVATVAELRQIFLSCAEFRGKYKVMHPEMRDHPSLSLERPALLFIHLQKTGGTSLDAMLGQHFASDRRCPVREDKLHLLTVAELGGYDFFSGHFDRSALDFIPRSDVKTVALFREPKARLVSFYRFLKSHPARDEFAGDVLIRIADESTIEEFFERPEPRSFAAVYNHYLIAMGSSFSWFDRNRTSLSEESLRQSMDEAQRQIRALTALGITERFDQSVELICKVLNFPRPASVRAIHVTDEFPEFDPRFKRVDPVVMTPRLADALEELTVYDTQLYQLALAEFERRCAEFDVAPV